MNKEKLLKELKKLLTIDGDIEFDHITADTLLIKFINDAEITNAYNKIKRVYA